MKPRCYIPEILFGALLAVAIFAMGYVVAASQVTSPPIEQKAAASAHQKGKNDDVNVGWWPWDATTTANIVIALFTGALFMTALIQNRGLRRANEIARAAAAAAETGAKASISLQLPIIRLRPTDLSHGDGVKAGKAYEECSIHHVELYNLGATKAFPTELLYGWTVGETLPDEPAYPFSERFKVNTIIEPMTQGELIKHVTSGTPLEPGQWSKICAGKYIWFYCAIVYDDFMGEKHGHGFCWRWVNVGMANGWREDATPAYNRKT